ncbi:MAG: signal peptide peptidase SppA [Alphaproteobacteria bacterium]|nr:signal peptide peptidase SppA [Alphaproteobacteria bacterium]
MEVAAGAGELRNRDPGATQGPPPDKGARRPQVADAELDAMLDRRRLKRRLGWWRLAAVVAVLALLGAVGLKAVPFERQRITRLAVHGFIMEDSARDRALRRLADDGASKAVLVRINSPGGSVAGSEELYLGLRAVAERKPVVAVIGTVGASGGYIVALAADHILARETAITGSIGAILQTASVVGLLDKLGIAAETVKSRPLKGQPSPFETFDPAARAAVQTLIDDSYRWFTGLVEARRKLTPEQLQQVADGRIFSGRQARERRLIDGFGGEEEARRWLETERDLPRGLPIRDLEYGDTDAWLDRLGAAMATALFGKSLLRELLMLDGLLALWQPSLTVGAAAAER